MPSHTIVSLAGETRGRWFNLRYFIRADLIAGVMDVMMIRGELVRLDEPESEGMKAALDKSAAYRHPPRPGSGTTSQAEEIMPARYGVADVSDEPGLETTPDQILDPGD